MLCEKCKIREANIKYTEVINGVKTEHNLCSQCAGESEFGQYSAIFDGEFPLGKLLSGLLGMKASSPRQERFQEVVCPTCKTTYEEFAEKSCFGCSDCYHVFDLLIGSQIKKLQESASHTGKTPRFQMDGKTGSMVSEDGELELTDAEQIRCLEQRLKHALNAEEYEEAAVCRDQIKVLREGIGNDKMV